MSQYTPERLLELRREAVEEMAGYPDCTLRDWECWTHAPGSFTGSGFPQGYMQDLLKLARIGIVQLRIDRTRGAL